MSGGEIARTYLRRCLDAGGERKVGFRKDGKITACRDGKGVSLGNCESLSLNPASKTLDATGDSKNGKKGVFQGIYRIKDGKLEWCAANPGIDRPKDFFTTPQVQFHMVFDKKK